MRQQHFLIWILLLLSFAFACEQKTNERITENEDHILVNTENYQLVIQKGGFRYEISNASGEVLAAAHPLSGLQISADSLESGNVVSTQLSWESGDQLTFTVETENGLTADVNLSLAPHHFKLGVSPQQQGNYTIVARTQGVTPAYGLADHAAHGNGQWDKDVRASTDLTGFEMNPLHGHRMVSNFAIFPQQGLAQVNIEPGDKLVRFTEEENAQGSIGVAEMPAFYYFIGSPKAIYKDFLEVRNEEGYPVYKPKYEWFGVGWEAFGALAWNTNHETVTKNVNQYLELGYPLRWMVVGSGFWPSSSGEFDEHGTPYGSDSESEEAKVLQATTSFGMWDSQLYPNPKEMIDYFHDQGLIFTIGLRIGFIPGGSFTGEGLENDYFIQDAEGNPKLFKAGFPEPDIYLIDAQNPAAVDWYVKLCQKWMDFGVDGFKEDLFGYPQSLPDDLIDPINRALMDKGVYIMGRNNYLGSPADIHRYNDFNYNQPQDRGPLNGLAYAYAGFPYVYPDIIGGTGLATGRFGDEPQEQLRVYLMRYAQYAAVNPSMSYGYGPWQFDKETNAVALEAAQLHERLLPYIYDAALDAYETGYPYPMTPMPVAYPEDEQVYHLADTSRRSYQWMIGESLLATPLFGDDYATAEGRDIYLPEGKWMDYDSGETFEGPTTLEDYPLPIGKTPLFVGGKGIVIELKDGVLKARVYPIAQETEMIFTDKDGETQSTISIVSPDWENAKILNTTSGEEVAFEEINHAMEFTLNPGESYRVE
ncbi:TIM-barrel domain-containing protein [Catalinimonas alkaloidigena]|uniref:TIM-barrel domain-containing protein n=1 Tax=Catalinimonas alkaloidigena TaxID=1075417 RepID=UPI002404C0A7|nr:TIM-barrel domain-containing protein [Catalinimonas alkaloidigena]